MDIQLNAYYSADEVAELLSMSSASIRKACREGFLPHARLREGGKIRILGADIAKLRYEASESWARKFTRELGLETTPDPDKSLPKSLGECDERVKQRILLMLTAGGISPADVTPAQIEELSKLFGGQVAQENAQAEAIELSEKRKAAGVPGKSQLTREIGGW